MANQWIEFVKAYAKKNNISYKEAISKARASYKGGKSSASSSKTKAKKPMKKMKKQGQKDREDEKLAMEVKEVKDRVLKRRGRPRKKEMEVVELDGEKVKFKRGGLRKALKVPDDYKFKKSELRKLAKIENGSSFNFMGKKFKMSDKLKKQIVLGINLMK